MRVSAAWNSLATHKKEIELAHLRDLYAKDPGRADRFRLEAAGLFLHYSKNRITDKTMRLLLQLADQSYLRERIDAMFRGDKINTKENRVVLPIALRTPKGKSIVVEVHAVLDRMAAFSNRVRCGATYNCGLFRMWTARILRKRFAISIRAKRFSLFPLRRSPHWKP